MLVYNCRGTDQFRTSDKMVTLTFATYAQPVHSFTMTCNDSVAQAASKRKAPESEEDLNTVLLEQEKKKLERSVRCLEDSNAELTHALEEEGNDPVYREAIGVSVHSLAHVFLGQCMLKQLLTDALVLHRTT